MNYMPIHTSIYPSYDFMVAENAFLKQQIEYKNAVLCEQQTTINGLQSELTESTQEKSLLMSQVDALKADANRWRIMKHIIRGQGGDRHLYDVERAFDKEMERVGTGKESVERSDRRGAGVASYPPPKPHRGSSIHAQTNKP